eukprot:3139-Pelagomonas_calceolata.AAC.2
MVPFAEACTLDNLRKCKQLRPIPSTHCLVVCSAAAAPPRSLVGLARATSDESLVATIHEVGLAMLFS